MTDSLRERIHRTPKAHTSSLFDWRPGPDPWINQGVERQIVRTQEVFERIEMSNSKPENSIKLQGGLEFTVPHQFVNLAQEIKSANYILGLEDDWDDEGGIGYSENTLKSAIDFVINYSLAIWEEESVLIDAPQITPGPDGSIDLSWDENDYRLLINVHPSPKNIASFYGDNRTDVPHIKGDFKLTDEPERAIILLLKKAKQ